MAYIKYKELTKYFDFNKEIDPALLPKYVIDYVLEDEVIFKAYKTRSDKGVFTNDRMILFDVNPITRSKKIHIMPYKSISSAAILYNRYSGSMLFSFDSGYQMKLNFVGLKAEEKTELRVLYSYIMRDVR